MSAAGKSVVVAGLLYCMGLAEDCPALALVQSRSLELQTSDVLNFGDKSGQGKADKLGNGGGPPGSTVSETSLEQVPWSVTFKNYEVSESETVFTYSVSCGEGKDLSHWGLVTAESFTINAGTTSISSWTQGRDGSTDIDMIKYDEQHDCPGTSNYVLVVQGRVNKCLGQYVVKGGTVFAVGSTFVPCLEQSVTAEGDPHLQNIMGESFDVWKVGTVDLLTHPRKTHHANLNLRVQATISKVNFKHKDAECDGPVISAIGFGGAWFGHKHVNASLDMDRFVLHVTNADHVNQLAPGMVKITRESEQQMRIQIGEAAFSVQAMERFHRRYLRFAAEHLASLDGEVGGLLGLDEHTDVSLAPEGCGRQAQGMLRTPTTEFMAVASM